MNIEIDVEQFAKDIKAGKSIGGKDGALSFLIKQLIEAALAAEIDSHLTQDLDKNRKNGYSTKTMKSDMVHLNLMFQEIEMVAFSCTSFATAS